jgi:hypothetical protein
MAGPHHQGEHRKLRAALARSGSVSSLTPCALCGQPLGTGQWHLAHDDAHPGLWLGPSHPRCNESRGWESPHRRKPARRTRRAPRTTITTSGRARVRVMDERELRRAGLDVEPLDPPADV